MRAILFCVCLFFSGNILAQESFEEDADVAYELKIQKRRARLSSFAWFGAGAVISGGSIGALFLFEDLNIGGQGALVGVSGMSALTGLMGTSAGYFKAGDRTRGRKHLTIQGVSAGVMLYSTMIGALALTGDIEGNEGFVVGSLFVGAVAAGVLGGCSLWNLYNVGRSPRRLYEAELQLSLLPQGAGLSLGRSF
jgi:hypothetical protein